jgi:8-oxo-dGTP diphosphatase
VNDVIEEGKSAVICSHRPALPTILESLSALASKDLARWIEEAANLKPAEMIVIQISSEKLKVVTAERWTSEPVI